MALGGLATRWRIPKHTQTAETARCSPDSNASGPARVP